MADEWKAGDLANCIETPVGGGRPECIACARSLAGSTVRRGGFYIVDTVEIRPVTIFGIPQVYLGLKGQPPILFHHSLFRKVPPIEDDTQRDDQAPVRPPEEIPA